MTRNFDPAANQLATLCSLSGLRSGRVHAQNGKQAEFNLAHLAVGQFG